jgi:hypothetical protein
MSEAASNTTTRSCGDCTLCCKVYPIPPMEKQRNVWCKACKPGRGCDIWVERPQMCRDFNCTWITDHRLGPEWKPNVAKFVMNWATKEHLHITVDPGSPLSYRKEPYYTGLKATAERCMAKNESVIIFSGENKFLMLPDGEQLIGPREEHLEWYVNVRKESNRQSYTIVVSKPAS